MFNPAMANTALQLVKAAVSLGHRFDEIRLKSMLGDPLPFTLPELPDKLADFIDEMEAYFQVPEGRQILELEGLATKFDEYMDPRKPRDLDFQNKLLQLYVTIHGNLIAKIGDDLVPSPERALQLTLSYYMRDSAKEGADRSVFMDIVLATADVVLEYVASNPSLVTRDEKIQGVITLFLEKFTVGNLEDLTSKQIFERTLSSLLTTAIEKRELVENEQAVSVFLETLGKLQEHNPDFVAGLVAGRGFDNLAQAVLAAAGENVHLFTDDEALKQILGNFLKQVAEEDNFNVILKGNDGLALVGQIAITQVAKHPSLQEERNGEPLWSAVLRAALNKVAELGDQRNLFERETVAALVQTGLKTVARDPDLLEKDFMGKLVTGIAEALSQTAPSQLFTVGSLNLIAERSITIAGENTDLIVKNDEFCQKVLAAVLQAGAEGFRQGFDEDFALELFTVAMETAGKNIEILGVADAYAEIVKGIIAEFSRDELKQVLVGRDLLEAIRRATGVVVANPRVWTANGDIKLSTAILRSIAEAFVDDPTAMLRGEVFVAAVDGLLTAVSRQAQAYAEISEEKNPQLVKLLKESLKALKDKVGRGLGADNVVAVLAQLLIDWGEEHFPVDASDDGFKSRVDSVLAAA